jgi:hypothetical protein
MVDSLAITAIITSIGALIVSFLTHIKRSSCYGLNITTTQSTTPTTIKSFNELNNEDKTESRPPSPVVLIQPSKPTISAPIPIPTTPLLTRQHYL